MKQITVLQNEYPRKVDTILLYAFMVFLTISLYLVFIWSPIEAQMGVVQKIFYFHVACAFIGFLAFFVVGFLSIANLIRPRENLFRLAGVSAEIGVVYIAIVLTSGPIWAKSAWNTAWTWEPKLTTALILFFIYIAFLILRKLEGSFEKVTRITSVFGIIGMINVPIVYFSSRWWESKLHPVIFEKGDQSGLEPSMLFTMLFCIMTISLLYMYLLRRGYYIEKARHEVSILKQKLFDQQMKKNA